MKLKTWLHENSISQRQFAVDLGVHWQHLNGIVNGSRRASVKLAFKIEEKTNGAVTVLDLLQRKSE